MLDNLEIVRTEKGKHYHKRHKDKPHALCSTRGPFWVITEEEARQRNLTYCQSCRRGEGRALIDPKVRQGEVNFDAVVWTKPISREGMVKLKEYVKLRQI